MESSSLSRLAKQSSIRSFFQPRSTTNPPLPSTNSTTQTQHPPESEESSEKGEQLRESTSNPSSDINALERQADPPKVAISAIDPSHIQQLKRINTLLLPMNYPDNFYNKILTPEVLPSLSFVVLWNSPRPANPPNRKVYTIRKEQQVVGGIVCRLELYPDSNTSSVYIQSLALLSPYRSQGLAAALLDTVIRTVVQLPPSTKPAPNSLYAHVWTENTEGIAWYKARGFIVDPPAPIENYYSRLRPGTAFQVRRHITPSDHLRHKSSAKSGTASKRSSNDWEMVESPNMVSPPQPAPAIIPFIAPSPPPFPSEPLPKPNKKPAKPAQMYLNFPPAPAPTPPASAPSVSKQSTPSHKYAPPTRPGMGPHTESFQNRAPESEWNDLPLDILAAANKPNIPRNGNNSLDTVMASSAPGSRSSSTSRTAAKKKRLYPAAAFGGSGAEGARQ